MTKEYKMQLIKAGVNLNLAMNRFMQNETLYEKFLRKFPSDTTFFLLKKNIEEQNIKESFAVAHTLKGICGNLELNSLMEIINPLTEKLRLAQLDETDEMIKELETRYNAICTLIQRYS